MQQLGSAGGQQCRASAVQVMNEAEAAAGAPGRPPWPAAAGTCQGAAPQPSPCRPGKTADGQASGWASQQMGKQTDRQQASRWAASKQIGKQASRWASRVLCSVTLDTCTQRYKKGHSVQPATAPSALPAPSVPLTCTACGWPRPPPPAPAAAARSRSGWPAPAAPLLRRLPALQAP